MSWFDYLKSLGGRDRLKEKIVHHDPTSGLRTQPQFYGSEVLINQLPLFHLAYGRLMLRSDPIVNFALNVRNAALMVAEVEITAKNEQVRIWVQKQWDTLWGKHRNKMLWAKAWGFAPLQIVFKADVQGMATIDDVKDFAPERVRAQECDGKVCGFNIEDRKVRLPQALWLTFNSEYGSPYGTGCLRRQYPAWYEKWTDHGAKKLLQLRMFKDAYIGDIWWYPQNQLVEVPDGEGGTKRIPWRDMAREIGENRLSGSATFLPSIWDDKEHKLLDYTPPQAVPGGTEIFEWNESCDRAILRGADVPIEVVEAQENGGFSGRSIPFMVVLSACTGELTEYIECLVTQVLRPVAWLNFGGDPEFEIKPKSLVESFAADASGSPMGGGAIGGQPGQKPPPQQVPAKQNGQGRLQFDETQPTDDIAALGATSARSRIRGAASRIRALKKNELTPLYGLADIIEQELVNLRRGLSADLTASMLGGNFVGAAEVWTALPAEFVPPPTAPGLPPAPPEEPPSLNALLGPDEPSPSVRFPVVEDALEVLADAPALARPDFRATAAAVREGAFAITGDLTDAAVADVRDLLKENLAKGPDREAFIDAVVDRLGEGGPLSEPRIEQIFRTNVAAAMSNGTEKALQNPMVVDAFPYRLYMATHDKRVRPQHLALEHLGLDSTAVYRADDPVWQTFRPPWSYACRCAFAPQSVEQAARLGVAEAKEWLSRAKSMAELEGGSEYQYFWRTAPAAPQWVQRPPFSPAPEFERGQFSELAELEPRATFAESLAKAFSAIPPPVVNVAAPIVTVNMPEQPPPIVNVTVEAQPAPVINVEAPTVNVAAPQITVEPPSVTVESPKVEVTIEQPPPQKLIIERDSDRLIKTVTPVPQG